MVASDTLVFSAAETGRSFSVEGADEIGNVLASIIDGARDFVRRGHRGDTQLQRRNHETLIDKNLGADWMVDRHEGKIIVIVNFPQFGGDAEVVIAVVGHKLAAANFVPLSGGRDLRGAESIDAQTNRRTPWDSIFHELHLLSVVGVEEWTRSLEALLGDNI